MIIKYNNSLLYYNCNFFGRPTFFILNADGDNLRYKRLVYIYNNVNFYIYFYLKDVQIWMNIRISTNVQFNPRLQYDISCSVLNVYNNIFNKKSDGDLFEILSKIKLPKP